MADYSFVTHWRVAAPIELAYDTIADSLAWPEWWPTVRAVDDVAAGDPSTGIGSVRRYRFRGRLPYELAFELEVTEAIRPTRLAGRATGELEGTGLWTLAEDRPAGVTVVRYDWNVRTTRRWMNLLAPIAGGTFRANHDHVMRTGAVGLGRRLGVRVTSESGGGR